MTTPFLGVGWSRMTRPAIARPLPKRFRRRRSGSGPYRSYETTLPASQTAAYCLFSSGVGSSASLAAEWPPRSDLPVAQGTARAFGRTPPSASGKTRIHSAPAATQTADRLASCPPDSAQSPLRSPRCWQKCSKDKADLAVEPGCGFRF